MTVDPEVLKASLQRLAREQNEQLASAGVVAALGAVTMACVDLLGVTGSGIMLADEQNVTRYVAASDGPGRMLETVESQTGQGVCTEAFVNNRIVTSRDIAADDRWPELARLMGPHGVHAVLGVPVRLGAVTVGTLDVYRDHPHEWTDNECAAAARYGDVVEATLRTALAAHAAGALADQLQYALQYRVVIERGVGYLMARDRIDAVTAFNRLRRAARNARSKIGDVAATLQDTGRLPGE